MVGEMRLKREKTDSDPESSRQKFVLKAKNDYSALRVRILCGERNEGIINGFLNEIINHIIEACLVKADICLCFRAKSDPFNDLEHSILNRQKSILIRILYKCIISSGPVEEFRLAKALVTVMYLYLKNFCAQSDFAPEHQSVVLNVYGALDISMKLIKPLKK
jgi:hypothetical protein